MKIKISSVFLCLNSRNEFSLVAYILESEVVDQFGTTICINK